MTLIAVVIATALVLSLAMTAAWAAVVSGARSGWIDAVWTFAVGAAGLAVALLPVEDWPASQGREWIVALLVAGWALRLGLHIAFRTAGGGEDPRYEALKPDWGANYRGRLFWFLQIQAAAALVLAATVFLAAKAPGPLGPLAFAGIGLFAISVLGEGVADRQLQRFKSDTANRGKVNDTGLWGWSRHPNYFFEWLVWVAFALIALDAPGHGPGWIALIGPAMMYWLLVHVSGIPPLEAHMERSRGAAFRAYQARVNAFWPGPPRRAALPSSMENRK